MKKFSQILIKEAKQINAQKDALGIISTARLEKYLKITDKFITDEAKFVVKFMITHEDWIKEMKKNGSTNPIVDFFNAGMPKDQSMGELYKTIAKLNKMKSLLEIPTFMTNEQFEGILSKSISPDEVFLDFNTESGRNEIAKKYTPLVHKIARSWVGKSAFDYDQLVSYAYEGLIWAINGYGKKSKKQQKREERGEEELDLTSYREYTFLSFASQMMRNCILDAIKKDSRLVRIPISQQNKEREENGMIAKSNSVSGDQPMGNGKDGEGQSLFDIVGGIENPGIKIDKEELDKLWSQILKKLEEKFGTKTMDIFLNHFGFGDKEPLSGKDMAAKYGYKSPASITAEVMKVVNFIKKDKTMFARFTDIYELMREHREDIDDLDTQNDSMINVNGKIMEDKEENYDDMNV
jgi:hypothetical protein